MSDTREAGRSERSDEEQELDPNVTDVTGKTTPETQPAFVVVHGELLTDPVQTPRE